MLDLIKAFFKDLSRIGKYYGLKAADEKKEQAYLDYAERMRILSNLRRTVVFTGFLILYILAVVCFKSFTASINLGSFRYGLIGGIVALVAFVVFSARIYSSGVEAGADLPKKLRRNIQITYTVFWSLYYVMLIYSDFLFTDWYAGLSVIMPMILMGILVPVFSLQEGFIPMSLAALTIVFVFREGGFELWRFAVAFPPCAIAITIADINHAERINAFYQEGKTQGEGLASRRRLGNVFEEIYDMALEFDPERRECLVLRNNDKFSVKHRNEIISFDEYSNFVEEIVHPDDAAIAARIMNPDQIVSELSTEGRNQVYLEMRILDAEGEYTWVSAYYTREKKVAEEYSDSPEYILCLVQNIQERKLNEDRLKLEAERDPLTQLYNKMTTRSLIEECLEKSPTAQHALIIIDIDNFKTINDTRGHTIGDQILLAFANELSRNFRESDILGRVGGDEFVVLIKNIQSIALVCDKLQRFTSAFKKYGIDNGFPGRLSTSIGVAVFSKDGSTYEELFKKADAALYEAKRNGKDQYKFSITRS